MTTHDDLAAVLTCSLAAVAVLREREDRVQAARFPEGRILRRRTSKSPPSPLVKIAAVRDDLCCALLAPGVKAAVRQAADGESTPETLVDALNRACSGTGRETYSELDQCRADVLAVCSAAMDQAAAADEAPPTERPRILASLAAQKYKVHASSISRWASDGDIDDLRKHGHKKNAPLVVYEDQIADRADER